LSTEIIQVSPALLELIRNGKGFTPFSREIMVLDTEVAGSFYYEVHKIVDQLSEGEYLILKREPVNEHDKYAISVYTQTGNKVGYIPKSKNEVIARLMDAGKLFLAKLEVIENKPEENGHPFLIEKGEKDIPYNKVKLSIKVLLKE